MFSSDELTRGDVYTRAKLKKMFGITDATINNGVFRPKGHDSVWLFVTGYKTADRTQYRDRLEFDVEDTSATEPYDLVARKGNLELFVEVKGTTSAGEEVVLTRNEVDHARQFPAQSVLFILADIVCVEGRVVRWHRVGKDVCYNLGKSTTGN